MSVTNFWVYNYTPPSASEYVVGDICQKGNFCPQKSTDMTSCYAGFYCPDEYQQAHDGAKTCREGFYCKGGTFSMTPKNPVYLDNDARKDTAGDICQKGYYCPGGSSKQFSCESGTFMPYQMALLQSDCISCPHGKYCDTAALWDLSGTTNDCDAGYYCELKAINARQNACGYDEKCESGSEYPIKCAPE